MLAPVQKPDLYFSFVSARDELLTVIDQIERNIPQYTRYAQDGTLGYLLRDKMFELNGAVQQLIFKDPTRGVEAFEDYGDMVLLLSERLEPHFPDMLCGVVDRHLAGWYAMGRLPVKDPNRLEI